MQIINVVEGTLLQRVAATYLGDATLWIYISQANGLIDSKILGMGQIIIPDVDSSLTGGIFV
jgi:hypothetical protein